MRERVAPAIRQAQDRDRPGLAQMCDAYRIFYGQPPDLEAAQRFVTARLKEADAVIFVAVDPVTDELVGFMTLYATHSLVRVGSQWLLEDLFVRPDMRRGGIAAALLQRAETFARATGAVTLTLSTARTNSGAQALYERSGYVRDTEFFHYALALRP